MTSAAKPDLSNDLPHVLVVDDDERLRDLLSRYLTDHGFFVSVAADAVAAKGILDYLSYDVVICDVMMPGQDGFSLVRDLKAAGFKTPVLMLTALGETESRIAGLEAGADDYLPKPFEPRELVLRLQAILRRVAAVPKPVIDPQAPVRLGAWTFDLERGEMTNGDDRMLLTAVEQTLLKALASRRGEVISREDLARMCEMNANERTIDVQVTRLRRKIEPDPKVPKYLQTVRGKGYVLWAE
jgi:two-component system phosphate regulon response regulator OmpR